MTCAGTEVKFVEVHVNFVKKDSTLLSNEEIQEAGKKDRITKASDHCQQGMEQVNTLIGNEGLNVMIW